MKSSQIIVPAARAEKRGIFQDLAGEEEDVGLACPPFDEEAFIMAAEGYHFDLSEEVFFSNEDHHKSAEKPVQGSSGNLGVKKTRHGKGKDMKVLEEQLAVSKRENKACKDTNTTTPEAKILNEPKTLAKAAIGDGKGKDMKVLEEQLVSKRENKANCKDTNTTTPEAKILNEPKKTLAKAAIGDGLPSFEEKISLTKRKLHERYEQVARDKTRKQIQVLSLSELPKAPQENGRPRRGFTPKFKSFAGSH